jgi:hypothetical protein
LRGEEKMKIEDCKYCETGNKTGLCSLHKTMENFYERGKDLQNKVYFADGMNSMALPYDK